MDFVSIDIETTGLDPAKDRILEFAAVAVFRDQPKMRAIEISVCDPDGRVNVPLRLIEMHTKSGVFDRLLAAEEMLAEGVASHVSIGQTEDMAAGFVIESHAARPVALRALFNVWCGSWLECGQDARAPRLNAAGKNFGCFDFQFLLMHDRRFGGIDGQPAGRSFGETFRRRFIDPAPFFMRPGDRCLPDLQTCIERAPQYVRDMLGQFGDAHGALRDAAAVALLCEEGMRLNNR